MNRLRYETSPYLLQHANNPVDWYPWGDEAFARAKKENKPLLVSIGYAACHWCHVMEHESFEDETVATFMNQHFINIKVDREEHPDVDHLYMDALQAMSGAGGWPLNMFVTPDRQPFYGGTYFPPRAMHGRSSWMELLIALDKAWYEKPDEITLQAGQMLQHLQQTSLVATTSKEDSAIAKEDIETIVQNLLQQADEMYGGFGAAPKFPATGAVQFLLEYAHFNDSDELAERALKHALFSVDKMIEGGIYDQLGGGFARYATDNDWLVPHFEKMLYDNALLITVLCDAYRITKKERYKKVIQETITFCKRELQGANEEGFYCALDADSEGVEGKFYTWTWAEWQELMPDAHPALATYFGVTKEGNWEHVNILNEAVPEQEIMERHGLSEVEWESILTEAKQKLFEKRKKRIRPATDDKILLSWNVLMNVALVKASVALEEKIYLDDAEKHLAWLRVVFNNKEGGWYHVYKNGTAKIAAKMDDYAYLVKALLEIASATGNENYILEAMGLTEYVQAHFIHPDKNFFYFSSDEQKDIPLRKVELYDGATPAANSMMMENLWILGNLTERGDWLEQSLAMLAAMKQTTLRYPTSFARWAILMQRYFQGFKQLIIVGANARMLLQEWERHYHPHVYVLANNDGYSTLPSFKHKHETGITLLYLCEGFSCRNPVGSIAELAL